VEERMAMATYTEALAGTYERKGTFTKVRLANVDILRLLKAEGIGVRGAR